MVVNPTTCKDDENGDDLDEGESRRTKDAIEFTVEQLSTTITDVIRIAEQAGRLHFATAIKGGHADLRVVA